MDTPQISYAICFLPCTTNSLSITLFQGDRDFFHFSPSTLSIRRQMYGISYRLLFQPVIMSGVLSDHHLWKSCSISCSVQNTLYSTPSGGVNSLVPQVIIFLVLKSLIVRHNISSADACTSGKPFSHATSMSIV